MLILGALRSSIDQYVLVGNWEASVYGRELRGRYQLESRLVMLDPIYEAIELARLREGCSVYIHGHSVGGTNPSLVEMLFYDCRILCFDVPYHRETPLEHAEFFPIRKNWVVCSRIVRAGVSIWMLGIGCGRIIRERPFPGGISMRA